MDHVDERRTVRNRYPSGRKENGNGLIAFEDGELSEWLINTIEDAPGQFLSALAEAAVIARAEEYYLVRPVLIHLKRIGP
jgi:hypothetical protein